MSGQKMISVEASVLQALFAPNASFVQRRDACTKAREAYEAWANENQATTEPAASENKCAECSGVGKYCLAGHSAHPSNWHDCTECEGTGKKVPQ